MRARARRRATKRSSRRISHVQGAFSLVADDKGSPDRRARPARLPAAGPRPPGRRRDCVLRNVRARSDRRDLRSRRRAGRSRHRQRCGREVVQAVSAGAVCALHVRACVFRAARQLCVRRKRQRSSDEPRPAAGARAARGRRRHRAGPRLGCVRGDRICRGVGHSDARRADPQPLCRAARSSSRSSRSGISACA